MEKYVRVKRNFGMRYFTGNIIRLKPALFGQNRVLSLCFIGRITENFFNYIARFRVIPNALGFWRFKNKLTVFNLTDSQQYLSFWWGIKNRFALTFGQYRLQPQARKLLTAFVKHTGFWCCFRMVLLLTCRDNLFLYLTEGTFSGFARHKDIYNSKNRHSKLI